MLKIKRLISNSDDWVTPSHGMNLAFANFSEVGVITLRKDRRLDQIQPIAKSCKCGGCETIHACSAGNARSDCRQSDSPICILHELYCRVANQDARTKFRVIQTTWLRGITRAQPDSNDLAGGITRAQPAKASLFRANR